MLTITLPTLAIEAAGFITQAPMTWSVPPLTLAVLLLMLRPTWRPTPYLAQLLTLGTAGLSIAGLFALVPAYLVFVMAGLALSVLLLDELLVQLPAIAALSSTLRRKS